MALPDLDEKCSNYFTYRDFVECSDSWKRTRVSNVPRVVDTYLAIAAIAKNILDPVQEKFGKIYLTYGFSSAALIKEIQAKPYPNITPSGDQHSGCELNSKRKPICRRGGMAVDLYVGGVSSQVVACWVADNTEFDRLYFYSPRSPFHVSCGPENNRSIVYMKGFLGGRHQPYVLTAEKLREISAC